MTPPSSTDRTREVLITRVFDATRETLFRAWTDPNHLRNWYAPSGCTIDFVSLDIRKGGRFHSCVRTPDGHECWCIGVYHELTHPSRIVHTMCIADARGNPAQPAAAGLDPEWPSETTVTITFEDLGGKTRVTLHQTVSESLAKRTGAHPSWLLMLDRLDRLVASR